ncbi:hypothetical protein ACTTAI_07980 [Rhodobacter capsulatus]|uniref:hypothetical protein n=1 Tax=Rhodobacter capsulatus TaxID=1061 RepID=UPI004025E5E0
MAETKRTATLTLDGKTYDLPVLSPSVGPDVLDIRKLYAQADVFTFDPGFTSTAACDRRSPISTATRVSFCTAAIRSSNWPKSRITLKSATCC